MKATLSSTILSAAISLGAMGCASTPAAPFNTMPTSQVTALHLQNVQPIPAAAAPGPAGMIPGLPPQLQTIITGAQQAIPGLPGLGALIPGLGGVAPAPAAPVQPMFQGFPIIKQNAVVDEGLRQKLAELLGNPDNFDSTGSCMHPEMGIGWGSGGAMNELLISFTCRQVDARTFAWPHPGRGLKQKTIDQLAELMPRLLP